MAKKKKASKKKASKRGGSKPVGATVKISMPDDEGLIGIEVAAGKRKCVGRQRASNKLALYECIGRLVLDATGRL